MDIAGALIEIADDSTAYCFMLFVRIHKLSFLTSVQKHNSHIILGLI